MPAHSSVVRPRTVYVAHAWANRPSAPGGSATDLLQSVDAVRRCWSSLFGARTVYYRAKRGFGQADMDIAVVVQLQVLSTRAGVMFTIDPASGDTDRLGMTGLDGPSFVQFARLSGLVPVIGIVSGYFGGAIDSVIEHARSLGVTPPVGFAGELTIRSRVFGVISDSVSSAENASPY